MKENLTVVGSRVPMVDAAAKVKGAAQFTDDLVLPGMLYGKALRSPLPHGKILHIDTSRAEKLPGVKGVMNRISLIENMALYPRPKMSMRLPKVKCDI